MKIKKKVENIYDKTYMWSLWFKNNWTLIIKLELIHLLSEGKEFWALDPDVVLDQAHHEKPHTKWCCQPFKLGTLLLQSVKWKVRWYFGI